MTTKLRSLRVTSEIDSSGYTRGAQQKVAADNAMISSGDRFGASLATGDMALQKLPAGMARLSRMWVSGYSEAEKFEKAVRQVGNAIDTGMDMDRAVTMLKAIETQFGRTANAAQLAKQGFVSVGSPLATAHVDQSGLNALLGSGGSGKSAQDSADIFQAAAVEQERMAVGAKALRAEIDPLGTAQDRLNAELLEYQALANAGVISTGELAMAQDLAANKFAMAAQTMGTARQQAKLNRFELQNLSFQLNDMAVMLASGQSPFVMLMQQGMQIGQLERGMGLKNFGKEVGAGILKFVTNPVNLAVLGFASLAAGAVYAYRHIKTGGETTEDLLKKQKDLLSELKDSYADMGLEVGKLAAVSAAVIRFEVGMNVEQSRVRFQKDLETVMKGITPTAYGGKGGGVMLNPQFLPFMEEIEGLNAGLKAGQPALQKFREDIADLPVPVGMTAKEFGELKLQVFAATKELDKFDRSTDQLSLSIDPLMQKMRRRLAFTDPLMGQKPSASSLYSMVPDNRAERERLEESYQLIVKNATGMGQVAQATALYQQAVAGLNSELTKSAGLHDLEIQAIYAKSPAQKAAIAAERERVNAINTGIGADELSIRAKQASTLAFQEATFAITEQNRARLVSANDNIATSRLELSLIGAGAAAQAEARANLASFLDLKRQAEANGLGFDQAYYELLKGQNHELSVLVELTARQSLATELDNERGYMGMSSREADIQKQLRGKGLEEGTGAWKDLHDDILKVKEAQDSVFYGFSTGFDQIRMEANDFASSTKGIVTDLYGGMEDALVEFVKTGKVNFQSLTDQMIEDIARMSYKLAMSGMLNLLMGGSAGDTSGMGGILGSLFKAPSLYAKGDVFDSPTAFSYGGGKTGVMGEDGPEAVVPLRRGRDGKLGIAGGSGAPSLVVHNTVHNNGSQSTARTETKQTGNQLEIATFIEDIVVNTMTSSKGIDVMQGMFGVRQAQRSR